MLLQRPEPSPVGNRLPGLDRAGLPTAGALARALGGGSVSSGPALDSSREAVAVEEMAEGTDPLSLAETVGAVTDVPTVEDSSALARAIEDELLDLVLRSADLTAFLARLSALAARDLSSAGAAAGVVVCSVTVGRNGRRGTAASSDPTADVMDELQYASGEGPCQESAATGQSVYVPDIRATERFPRYREAVAASPLRSVFAAPIPLPTSAQADAALNCYSTEVNGFPEDLRERAEELASLASRSLHTAVRLAQEGDRADDLAAALESRTAINLAAGVVMAQSNCSPQQAIEFLKNASMNRNQKLRDIATAILSRYGDPDPRTYFT